MSFSEERLRILKLIESGQISAEEGARLIEALGEEAGRARAGSPRTLHVRVTDLGTHRHKVSVAIPVTLVRVGLKLGARLSPHAGAAMTEEILQAIESGRAGRILDLQNLEEGERVEIFVE